jgi:hypothetical protein
MVNVSWFVGFIASMMPKTTKGQTVKLTHDHGLIVNVVSMVGTLVHFKIAL